MNNKPIWKYLLSVLAVCLSAPAKAQDNQSFKGQSNKNPLVAIHGLPVFMGAQLLPPGQKQTQISIAIVNEFLRETSESEQISLDFERTYFNIDFAYGLVDGIEAGISIPFISDSGGFLDGFIDTWHDTFGLPEGGRDQASSDQFQIVYQNPRNRFSIDQKQQGIGDVAFWIARQLFDQADYKVAARLKLKLPTADTGSLFGSGGVSVSTSIDGYKQLNQRWSGFGSVAGSYLEKGDILSNQQKHFVVSATLGSLYSLTPRWAISGQLAYNSRVYAGTALAAVQGEAGILAISAQYRPTKKAVLEFGFSEDLISKGGAPDFAINLSWRHQF